MKKLFALFVFVSLLFRANLIAQKVEDSTEKTINETYINHRGDTHLVGETTRDALKQAPFQEWYAKNYEYFEVNERPLKEVKSKLEGVSVKLFMGTWCGDSKREVPKFLKVMDYLGLSEEQLSIVNLYDKSPNYKQGPNNEETGLNIHRVPTFIFYKAGKEIGRIVESPLNSMEIDVAQILFGVPSRPNYRAVTALSKMLKERGVAYLKENKEMLASRVRYTVKNDYELNTFGYVLLDTDEKEAAVAILEINALTFPNVPNVFDSLAEGYLAIDKKDMAIANYEKVLLLDKENQQAKEKLVELKKGKS